MTVLLEAPEMETVEPVFSPPRAQEPVGTRILGPGGVVARNLPSYESRQAQQEMADLVEVTLRDGGTVLIEAGTGTGKSLAYLIPAIEAGEKVVVSTESNQLLEQLYWKDIPFIEKALGRRLKVAYAKGRGNYFCERNATTVLQELEGKFEATRTADEEQQLEYGQRLYTAFDNGMDPFDGNKAKLHFDIPDLVWDDFAGDDSCTGKKCPNAGRCAYMEAKALLVEADIVITNHHYCLLHWYLYQRLNVALLPDHRIWIADEAHTLPDIAQKVWGIEIRQGQPRRLVTKLQRQLKALKLSLPSTIKWEMPEIEKASEEFFDVFRQTAKDEQVFAEYRPEQLATAHQRLLRLLTALSPLRIGINILSSEQTEPEVKSALATLQRNFDGLCNGLEVFFKEPQMFCPDCGGKAQDDDGVRCARCLETPGKVPNPDPPVFYVELTQQQRAGRHAKKHVTLHAKPIETKQIFRDIREQLHAAIYTSATLSVAGSFTSISDELGLDPFDTETFQAPSPFDYAQQVRGYAPKHIPAQDAPNYHDKLTETILEIVHWTQGRAFILFTSNRDLREVCHRLRMHCHYPLLVQGDAPKQVLIDRFKEEPSVLLGVRTFWTGVDIPGEALSCVVITKFPFPTPDAPLVKARCERIDARAGGKRKSFEVYSIPRCVRDVQQGFGRLIRRSTDRGLFALLDPRLHTKGYGQIVRRSLPDFPWSDALPTDWQLEAPNGDGAGVHATDGPAPEGSTGGVEPANGREGALHSADAAQPDLSLSGTVDGVLRQPGQVVVAPTLGHEEVPDRSADRPRPQAWTDPRTAQEDLQLTAPGDDAGRVEGAPGPAGRADGAVRCDRERTGEPAAAPASCRWQWLRAWMEAHWFRSGPGTGAFIGRLTDAERRHGAQAARELYALGAEVEQQGRKVDAREAWLAANPHAPDMAQRRAATQRSRVKLDQLSSTFTERQDELILWADADPTEFVRLVAQAVFCDEETD